MERVPAAPFAATGGLLITLEGVEGAGKSTQMARLADWLAGSGARVVTTSEPDGSPLGSWVRQALAGAARLDPLTECFLFATARAEHVRRVIRPARDGGALVLCDRYVHSTLAYQGYGRGVPLDVIAELNRLATDGLAPDLTLVLDLDVAEGLRRARARMARSPSATGTRAGEAPSAPAADGPDPFERLGLDFHERVRKGYREMHERDPERVALVDGGQREDAVAAAIRAVVGARLAVGGSR